MNPSRPTRRSSRRRPRRQAEQRPLVEPNAAGIDVGARQMYVAIPPDRDQEPVRLFSTFTQEKAADLKIEIRATSSTSGEPSLETCSPIKTSRIDPLPPGRVQRR